MRLKEISKAEFKSRLVDPLNHEIEKQVERFSKTLNHAGWNAAVGKVTNNSWELTAYKVKPDPSYDHENVRGILLRYFISNGFEEIHDIEITFEDQDDSSITWNIEAQN